MRIHFSDIFWYVVIGLLVVLGIVLWATYIPEKYNPGTKWVAFTAATVVTFGCLLPWYSRYRSSAKFWALWCFFLAVHVGAYIFYLRRIERWPLILFALITPIEWSIICPLLDRVVRPSTAGRQA